jgi:hypothetical protein
MRKIFLTSFYNALTMTLVMLISLQLGFAQVATSTNYQLQSDSINFGGGFSSSTNYVQESTFGEIGTGRASSTNYQLRGGYQQMQEVYIAITPAADVTMSPSLGGLTGGTSNGSTGVTVTTDSPAGYSLTIEAQNNPAMQNGSNSIPDYVPVGITADGVFITPPGAAAFGYTVDGDDVISYFFSTLASSCLSGSLELPNRCWTGLQTTPFEIARSSNSNHPSGTVTTIDFRVGVDAGAGVIAGLYTATTTLTALPL